MTREVAEAGDEQRLVIGPDGADEHLGPVAEQHVLDGVLPRETALVRRRGGLGLFLGVVAGNRRRLAPDAHEIPARGARLDVAAHGVGE